MIKDATLREELLHSFPNISAEDEEEIYLNAIPHVVFYRSVGKNRKECVCSRCGSCYEESPDNRMYTNPAAIKHNAGGRCLQCGADITYRSAGMSNGAISDSRNACIMIARNGALWIRCYWVKYVFPNIPGGVWCDLEDIQPQYLLSERHRYYIAPGQVQHWRRKWYSNTWESVQSENEPIFTQNGMNFNYAKNNSYLLINPDIWPQVFPYSELQSYFAAGGSKPIKYLSFYATHPNAEYLFKTGYGNLVCERIDDTSAIRINWKANDVRRMLGLNKEEFATLVGSDGLTISRYKEVRKMLPGESVSRRCELVKNYGTYLDRIGEIQAQTDLPYKTIFSYADKQQNGRRKTGLIVSDWIDYLRECKQLGYDLKSATINRPKDLYRAHRRTSELVTALTNREKAAVQRKQLRERKKLLEQYVYTDKELGLQIVIPKSVSDIVQEGKLQNHCVGGYADRHVQGTLTILFVRRICKPDVPYYTMEVSEPGRRIIQCRGYQNDRCREKPKIIERFEARYQQHLNSLKKATNVRFSA